VGGAWWQWKQACGDPHSIGTPDGHPPAQTDSLVRLACPSDSPVGIPESFQRVLGRAYPRAAPGVVRTLTSDPVTGTLHVAGTTDHKGVLDLWMPAAGGPPVVGGTNVTGVRVVQVDGGYRVTAKAVGVYALDLTR
jgi:endoglycosylceramidase